MTRQAALAGFLCQVQDDVVRNILPSSRSLRRPHKWCSRNAPCTGVWIGLLSLTLLCHISPSEEATSVDETSPSLLAQTASSAVKPKKVPNEPSVTAATAVVYGTLPLDSVRRKSPRARRAYAEVDGAELGPPPPFVGVVYLTGDISAEALTPPAEPVVMRQEGLQFHPYVLPVVVGSAVSFPNEDNTFHNVFSYSPAKRFDLGRFRRDEKPPQVVFDEVGTVRIFCEVHEHMRATVLVLDTPYFTTTDESGQFRLEGVPAGKYVAHAWLSPREEISLPVTLKAGEERNLTFRQEE